MTDRYNALTVALSRDIRDDDAQGIIDAIKHLKGVENVTGQVVDIDSYVAESRVKQEVAGKLMEFVTELYKPKNSPPIG